VTQYRLFKITALVLMLAGVLCGIITAAVPPTPPAPTRLEINITTSNGSSDGWGPIQTTPNEKVRFEDRPSWLTKLLQHPADAIANTDLNFILLVQGSVLYLSVLIASRKKQPASAASATQELDLKGSQ
jgi:hypothetical protein